jgi:hypothetical protein
MHTEGLGHTKHRRGNDHEKAQKFIYQQTGNREKTVRNVISGLETNPIRALIGGACLVWQWTPSRTAQQ